MPIGKICYWCHKNGIGIQKVFYFTDSQMSLAWIRNEDRDETVCWVNDMAECAPN